MDGRVRVVLGNEPRAYRDIQAAAFRALRPGAEVVVVEPADLDGAIVGLRPHLVVCSCLSEAVRTGTHAWVLLYEGGDDTAVVSVAGRQHHVRGIAFEALLAVLDQAALRAVVGSGDGAGSTGVEADAAARRDQIARCGEDRDG